MKTYLLEIYNDKTNWKIRKTRAVLGMTMADIFRAGVNMYLEKIEADGAIKFPDEEYKQTITRKQ